MTNQTVNDFPLKRTSAEQIKKTESQQESIARQKLELVRDILNIGKKMNLEPFGRLFDELMDMDIDQLYSEVIKAQDKYFEWSSQIKNIKLNY